MEAHSSLLLCVKAVLDFCLTQSSPLSPGPPTPPPRSIEVHRPAHCSTVTYLLTTHSTEVAVDEAMYLVETSEAAFIGGDREEAAVEYKSIAEAMEDEIEGAERTSTGSCVTSFPPFVVDTVASYSSNCVHRTDWGAWHAALKLFQTEGWTSPHRGTRARGRRYSALTPHAAAD